MLSSCISHYCSSAKIVSVPPTHILFQQWTATLVFCWTCASPVVCLNVYSQPLNSWTKYSFFFIAECSKIYKNAHTYTHKLLFKWALVWVMGPFLFRTVNYLKRILTEMERRNNCFIAPVEAGPSIRLPRVLQRVCTMCGWGWDSVIMGIEENKSLCVCTA